MSNPVTDLRFLRENTFGNQATMRELIELYLNSTPGMISQMREANDSGNLNGLQRIAHKLKSNIHTMGMKKVLEILDKIEHAGNDEISTEQIAQYLVEIEEQYEISKEELQGELLNLD